jgi:hypothetical protein
MALLDGDRMDSVDEASALAFLAAAMCRVYPVQSRRAGHPRPGEAALALVPATALLAGGALALPAGAENLSFALLWSAGSYVLTGESALVVGLRWRRPAA